MTTFLTAPPPPTTHDPRLVWRFHLQTVLRMLPMLAPALVILPLVFGPWL